MWDFCKIIFQALQTTVVFGLGSCRVDTLAVYNHVWNWIAVLVPPFSFSYIYGSPNGRVLCVACLLQLCENNIQSTGFHICYTVECMESFPRYHLGLNYMFYDDFGKDDWNSSSSNNSISMRMMLCIDSRCVLKTIWDFFFRKENKY
jgi:hypothetical protein